jgi:ABC-type sugar transport system ATPase subunit
MRLIEGVFPPDEGRILSGGRPVTFASPRDAHAEGVRVIHQEPEIVPHMTVAENVYIGHLPSGPGYSWTAERWSHKPTPSLPNSAWRVSSPRPAL